MAPQDGCTLTRTTNHHSPTTNHWPPPTARTMENTHTTEPAGQIELRDPQDLRSHPATRHLHTLHEESAPFIALLHSIQTGGFDPDKPVTITESGGVLDGRHRWRAARKLGLSAIPCVVRPESDAATVILNSIIARKHFTKSAIAFEVYPLFKQAHEEATARHLDFLKKGKNPNVSPSGTPCRTGTKRVEDLAESFGISETLFKQAARVHKLFVDDPEYASAMLPRIFSEPLGGEHEEARPVGLGAVIAGWEGRDKTKDKKPVVGGQLELFSESLTKSFQRWAKIEDVDGAIPMIRRLVAELEQEDCERLELLVGELQTALKKRKK